MEQKKFNFSRGARCVVFEFLLKELNLMNSSDLRKNIKDLLEENNFPDTVFNLGNVEFVDSTGIGTMIAFYNTLKANGKKMFVVGVSKRVQQIFNLAKLDKMLAILPTMEDALKQLG